MLDLQIIFFRLVHKGWTQRFQNDISLLYEICENQSKSTLIEISEFQISVQIQRKFSYKLKYKRMHSNINN